MDVRQELQESLKSLVAKHGWNEVDLELRLLAHRTEPKNPARATIVMGQNGEVEWIDNWICIPKG